jgi:hypothetical protein
MSELPAPPDPISAPEAYQAYLLDALGADDPATVQAGTPPALRQLVREGAPHLRKRAVPGAWSALETMGHMLDAEIVYSARYRFIMAHDEPPLLGYDQDLWVERLRHNDDDVAGLLDHFEAMRLANIAMWRHSTPVQRGRVGIHEERGPESLELSFRLIAGHDRVHLAQARDALFAAGRH